MFFIPFMISCVLLCDYAISNITNWRVKVDIQSSHLVITNRRCINRICCVCVLVRIKHAWLSSKCSRETTAKRSYANQIHFSTEVVRVGWSFCMANSIIRGVDRVSRRWRLRCGDGTVGQVDVSLFRRRLLTYAAAAAAVVCCRCKRASLAD